MDEVYENGILIGFKFKPQGWHVESLDSDGNRIIAGFATRKGAEEFRDMHNADVYEAGTFETLAVYYLCDCENRKCKFMARIAGL
jgi:hypothetical protein